MDIAQAITGGGLILLLASVIGYLLNANWRDRQQQQDVLKRVDARIESMETAHNQRVASMESRYEERVARLERRIDTLEREVENERALRLTAEFDAAHAKHRLSLLRPIPPDGETG